MSVVITIMNMKGGVGKTTVALHLAGLFARFGIGAGQKILLIDYDPQFNASQALLRSKTYFDLEKKKRTTLSVLVDDLSSSSPFHLQVPGNHLPPKVKDVVHRVYENKSEDAFLDLVPSTLSLMYVALGKSNIKPKPIEERFAKFIDEARGIYDYIFIDCHPAGSVFTQTSLQNTDHLIIPVVLERYAARGIGLMLEFLQSKEVGDKKIRAHILFNKTPRRGVLESEAELRNTRSLTALCMRSTLRKFKAFSEPEEGDKFVWASKKSYRLEALSNLFAVGRDLMTRIQAP